MQASSLSRHLADMHSIYQQTVVAKEMLECRPAETYEVSEWSPAGLSCPFPRCGGILSGGWMMRRHFRDIHPLDLVMVLKEGKFCWCRRCGMQVRPPPIHKGVSGGGPAEETAGGGGNTIQCYGTILIRILFC